MDLIKYLAIDMITIMFCLAFLPYHKRFLLIFYQYVAYFYTKQGS